MYIDESKSPFHKDEAYFSEAAFFNELAKDGDNTPARVRGVPLPAWEALEEQKQKSDEKAFTSTDPPRIR